MLVCETYTKNDHFGLNHKRLYLLYNNIFNENKRKKYLETTIMTRNIVLIFSIHKHKIK